MSNFSPIFWSPLRLVTEYSNWTLNFPSIWKTPISTCNRIPNFPSIFQSIKVRLRIFRIFSKVRIICSPEMSYQQAWSMPNYHPPSRLSPGHCASFFPPSLGSLVPPGAITNPETRAALFWRNFLRVYSTIISGITNSLAGAWEYGGGAPGKFV